ncbi:MAG: hypothetical protein IKW39_00435 [Alphaproteobacteria bacterium]|nr:hypothetical protein [Alphaproteobacteria bacterium]
MFTEKEVNAMNITFDFSNQFAIARVPQNYEKANEFALECVYSLWPYIAKVLNVAYSKLVLIAISGNNKSVVFSFDCRMRDYLYCHFNKPSLMYAQFYDDVEPELIIEKMKTLYE